MKALTELQAGLSQINETAFRGLENPDLTPIEAQVSALRRMLDSDGAGRPSRNLLQAAIATFLRDGETRTFRDSRLLSYGLLEPIRNRRLIDDQNLLPQALGCVAAYLENFRAFRRCYRGLLAAYFSYDPEHQDASHDGKQNFGLLRAYLRDHVHYIEGPGMVPAWVAALREHKNLLTDEPCRRYANAALAGDWAEFQQVKNDLGISDASWVTRQLFRAQINAAVTSSDAPFKRHLPAVLGSLEQYPLLLQEGLVAVLNRYSRCGVRDVNPDLRDFAVEHWGNPWLPTNSARWHLVDEAARDMVASWLKLDFIFKFFNLLSDDGRSDPRRLQFWLRYHEHIHDMYFALGPSARWSTNPEFVQLRKTMEGRRLDLTSPGSNDNNAFIMCIGNYVVVEFGKTGNACFVFRRDGLPFELHGSVAANGTALKHVSHIHRLLHHDKSWQTWEESFERVISRQIHVRPAETDDLPDGVGRPSNRVKQQPIVPSAVPERSATPANRTGPTRTPPRPERPNPREPISIPVFGDRTRSDANAATAAQFNMQALQLFCERNGLEIRDRRPQGGNLWVAAEHYPEHVSNQLLNWGFKFKNADKGWWRS